jgi:hypothetical protein
VRLPPQTGLERSNSFLEERSAHLLYTKWMVCDGECLDALAGDPCRRQSPRAVVSLENDQGRRKQGMFAPAGFGGQPPPLASDSQEDIPSNGEALS